MIIAVAAITLFLAYCLLLSLAARREWAWLDRYLPNALLFLGFWFLFLLAGAVAVPPMAPWGALLMLPVAVLGVLLALPYASHVTHLLIDAGARAITGVDRLPPHPGFDKADKAVAEKRYEDAVRIYLEAAVGVPSDPEPLRRAGEASLLAGQDEVGLSQLRSALELTMGPEDRASLGFRVAELLERRLSRPDEARELLVSLATELKGTRFESYAWDRHAAMAGP